MAELKDPLPPEVRDAISRLDLSAHSLVEGMVSGLHRSPYHGFSVEFAQHREYALGDEIKHVDWKVYAKTDRYYVKQYEEETNLHSQLLVDCSESMTYKGPRGKLGKYEYACTIAAALAFILIRQQDAPGLLLFDQEVRAFIRPRRTRRSSATWPRPWARSSFARRARSGTRSTGSPRR
jgi:uncharacterized protein (DUF58 family)